MVTGADETQSASTPNPTVGVNGNVEDAATTTVQDTEMSNAP